LWQGSLDVRYLTDRYQRGVKFIETYTENHQRYLEMPDLAAGLPDFLSAMQKEGGVNKLLA